MAALVLLALLPPAGRMNAQDAPAEVVPSLSGLSGEQAASQGPDAVRDRDNTASLQEEIRQLKASQLSLQRQLEDLQLSRRLQPQASSAGFVPAQFSSLEGSAGVSGADPDAPPAPRGAAILGDPTGSPDIFLQGASQTPLFDTEVPAARSASKKYPTWNLTGLFQLDYFYTDQSPRNLATVGANQDYLGFRRARLASFGELFENISYFMEFDFAASQPRFIDVWVNFGKIKYLGNLRVGRFRQPFGMDELTSIRELAFLERALTSAVAPFRQTGIMAYNALFDGRMTYAVSGYRFGTDGFGNVFSNSGAYGTSTRLTGLPFFINDHNLIHVGFDYTFVSPENGTLAYAYQPEIIGIQSTATPNPAPANSLPPYINTGTIAAHYANLFNVEGAWVYNSFAIQAEARWASINQLHGGTRTLPLSYIQWRYVLTGEDIPYNQQGGVITRIRPFRPVRLGSGTGIGAWEIAGRWSYADFNGTSGTGPGNTLNDFTWGVNWYLNNNAKVQFNYIHPYLINPRLGPSNADFYALRTQIDF